MDISATILRFYTTVRIINLMIQVFKLELEGLQPWDPGFSLNSKTPGLK